MRRVAVLLLPLFLMACMRSQDHTMEFLRDRASQSTIAHGTVVAESDELAKMAIRLFDGKNPHVACSSVLLSSRVLLSARHCIVNKALDEKGYRLSHAEFQFTDNLSKRTIAIQDWRVHPSADLALVILQEEAPSDYRPAVLRSIQEFSGAPLVLLGFGRRAPDAPADGVLRSGSIHASSLIYNESSIEASIDEPESAVCPGDSGGPAYVREKGSYFLVGIATRADLDCAAYAHFVRPERFVAELYMSSSVGRFALPLRAASLEDVENRRVKELIELSATSSHLTGAGVRIAVVDTGFSLPIAASISNVESGYNAVDSNANFDDQEGHGTGVAGIILQLSPNARILPVKVSDDGVSSRKAVVNGIVHAIRNKAKLINASLSLSESTLKDVRQAVGAELFNQVLIVISAGNDGHRVEPLSEKWENVIMVGASTLEDPPIFASYSAQGPGVDIVAPAGGAGDGISTFCVRDLNCVRSFNGTSAAAPVVTAVAALVAEAHPTADPSEIKMRILKGARSIERFKEYARDGRFLSVRGALDRLL
jgi:hypothetical protein